MVTLQKKSSCLGIPPYFCNHRPETLLVRMKCALGQDRIWSAVTRELYGQPCCFHGCAMSKREFGCTSLRAWRNRTISWEWFAKINRKFEILLSELSRLVIFLSTRAHRCHDCKWQVYWCHSDSIHAWLCTNFSQNVSPAGSWLTAHHGMAYRTWAIWTGWWTVMKCCQTSCKLINVITMNRN